MAGPMETRVPGPIADQMLAALREGLANAAKHAKASQVDVTVEAGTDLVLRVRDNGVGLPKTQRRSGLANLAERAGELGGTFRADPAEGGGTELEWRVPLPAGSSPGPDGS
jgi:signal transduction histidine kinase